VSIGSLSKVKAFVKNGKKKKWIFYFISISLHCSMWFIKKIENNSAW
jgi:hypothetical protein